MHDVVSKRLRGGFASLRASSLFGGYREKWTRERHARGDAKAGLGVRKASRPLAASPLTRAFSCSSLRSPKQESLLAGYGFARHLNNIALSAICSWSLNATKLSLSTALTVKTLLIFLEYIFELLINTALPASNSVYRQNFMGKNVKRNLNAHLTFGVVVL